MHLLDPVRHSQDQLRAIKPDLNRMGVISRLMPSFVGEPNSAMDLCPFYSMKSTRALPWLRIIDEKEQHIYADSTNAMITTGWFRRACVTRIKMVKQIQN